MHRATWGLMLLACGLAGAAGCCLLQNQKAPVQKIWKAQPVAVLSQFAVPECALVDQAGGTVYVSNMDTETGTYWADDGVGHLSLLRPRGVPADLRWRASTPEQPLHSPKGMCLLKGVLYVADNTRVVGYPTSAEAAGPKPLTSPAGQRLNDMATDGQAVYVSDTAAGVVYRLDPKGVTHIKAPPGVNGITFFDGRMFAVSWDLRDVYELDPSGQGDPVPFGLMEHFMTPDGIEVLEDGTFLVSDMHGGRIVAIAPDRLTVRTLLEVKTPADIGLDRARRLLYIPQFEQDCVMVCQLTYEKP